MGFDTGLNAQAFAQAKMALFITQPGFIVYPEGDVETWHSGGVAERETMIIWGSPFPGERLSEIINTVKDEALDSLRFWLKARTVIEKKLEDGKDPLLSGPAGALIVTNDKVSSASPYPYGTVFFPPYRLLKRTLEAEGAGVVLEAERYVHPDLEGTAGVSFSAGAMLYRIFCGAPPFPKSDEDELHQDIREGVFIPPDLAAPGLDPEMSSLITRLMTPRRDETKPSPDSISGFIGPSKPVSSWVKPLDKKEISRIQAEHEQYAKKKTLAVKRRRFVNRNAAIITGSFIAVVVLALFVRGILRGQAERPTTKGMSLLEIAETYYGAFGNLDHATMEACVTGRAGKGDIDMVVNFFVINRVRQAYEISGDTVMSVQEWIDAGRPATDKTVFGITDLKISVLSEDRENARLEADYILWMPSGASAAGEQAEEGDISTLPRGLVSRDTLGFAFQKGAWRITEISRTRQ